MLGSGDPGWTALSKPAQALAHETRGQSPHDASIGCATNRKPRVLVACEFSGVVRRAFRALGHEAWSCDLLPTEDDSPHHVQGDARDLLDLGWDLLIAHPPCTRLCNSGVRWLHERDLWAEMREACGLFLAFLNAPVPHVAVENPVMHGHAREIIGRGPDFTIQPWQFGHGEIKRTCFWTRNLPPLEPTDIVSGREARVHRASPGPYRWKQRSITFPGVATAMAEQWGAYVTAASAAPQAPAAHQPMHQGLRASGVSSLRLPGGSQGCPAFSWGAE